ncbi:hypothetical protein CYK37_17550 [Mesorhizobium loti]|nr:alpha/beta fold hydrolase [Mesorhizobium loti]PLP58012.1 hypothetical protein CYK37_17550 [Mesorhizobium loti]
MARDQVQVIGRSPASPEAVWAVARDFCGHWHPGIATIRAERDARGSLVRAFTAHGEPTLYRERLTWFSDSDRSLAYTHLEGIAGVDRYDARLAVSSGERGGSTIEWVADVEAPDAARAASVCLGTRPIFEAGIDALSRQAGREDKHQVSVPFLSSIEVEELSFGDAPCLAMTITPKKQGPLCLFLHGIGGGRANWLPQLAAVGNLMSSAALDLRGYGGSTHGPNQSTIDNYCADILRVRETLGADRLVLVGLSYGSWIATSFAMRYPDLLAGLVLSGGCTGMSEAGVEEREAFRVSRLVPIDAGQTPADFAPSVVKILAGPNASDTIKAQLLQSMAAISAATYRDALLCFTNPPERFDFARLNMPVLMMTGEHDRLASPAEIRGVAQRILAEAPKPDVRYETIIDAGHVCNVEQPAAYNRILLEFLGKLPK